MFWRLAIESAEELSLKEFVLKHLKNRQIIVIFLKDPKVKYVDLGGSYVGKCSNCLLLSSISRHSIEFEGRGQDRLLRLIKEFGLKTYLVNEIEDIVHLKNVLIFV